jgi:hypothetical protein
LGLIFQAGHGAAISGDQAGKIQHLVFGQGTPHELEVFKIFGRIDGPTVMLLGGIHGNEPGAYLSADLYAKVRLKRGNLIVVPRANFRSIVENKRGSGGDMNRKFAGTLPNDPEKAIVDILKSLMAESDVLITLHDGSGFFRPEYVSPALNPMRYGQSIIADAAAYTPPGSGKTIPLEQYAEIVLQGINKEISDPRHAFHFFNMRTATEKTLHREQRHSATFYALTELGLPAFCVETSHDLPNLEMKVHHHNLAVNAFLDLFGVEMDHAAALIAPPRLGHAVIAVGDHPPLAALNGQTLLVAPGETVTVLDMDANYHQDLSATVEGAEGGNILGRPLAPERPVVIALRWADEVIGRIGLEFLPENGPPRLSPPVPWRSVRAGEPAAPAVALAEARPAQPAEVPVQPTGAGDSLAAGRIAGFLVDVDGRRVEVVLGGVVAVPAGAKVTMVDFKVEGGGLPPGVVMNLRGFVPQEKIGNNDGEDRGFPADTGREMRPAFSRGGQGRDYAINAERGETVLATATLSIIKPRLESVTLVADGERRVLPVGGRVALPEGTAVTVTEIKLAEGLTLSRPVYTLGGRAQPSNLPLNLTVPSFAANLAVFNGETLAGKVTLAPLK